RKYEWMGRIDEWCAHPRRQRTTPAFLRRPLGSEQRFSVIDEFAPGDEELFAVFEVIDDGDFAAQHRDCAGFAPRMPAELARFVLRRGLLVFLFELFGPGLRIACDSKSESRGQPPMDVPRASR